MVRVAVGGLAGLVLAYAVIALLPPRYVSEAIFRFNFVGKFFGENIPEHLAYVKQKGLSDERLSKIIRDFGLYKTLKGHAIGSETIRRMRERDLQITFFEIEGRGWGCCYKLSFASNDGPVTDRVLREIFWSMSVASTNYTRQHFEPPRCPELVDCGEPGMELLDTPSKPSLAKHPILPIVGLITGLCFGFVWARRSNTNRPLAT